MFQLEKNSKNKKDIFDYLPDLEKKVEKNKVKIIVVYLGLLFLAFFGKETLGDWFSGLGEFLKMLVIFSGYIAFMYLKNKKENEKDNLELKNDGMLKEKNIEKVLGDSIIKNSSDTIFNYEKNKDDILKNSIGDINNSKEE